MSEQLKCAKCGAENPKANKFCDTCGYKLIEVRAAEQKKPAADEAVQEKHGKLEKRKAKKPEPAAVVSEVFKPHENTAGSVVINWEIIAWIGIMIIAILIRFYDLGTKPMHHDESMHAFYAWKLYMGEGYTYHPMLHGPVHYHAAALAYFLFGVSDYTARVAPAVFGIAGILFVWFLRPYIGRLGAVITAFIMTISPTFAYQARFIREDIFMAVETFMIFIGLMRYFDTKKTGWLIFAAVGFALAWATKEANYITMFIFGTFLFFRWLWEHSLKSVPEKLANENKVLSTVEHWLGKGKKSFLYALIVFVLVHGALFYGKQGGIENIWSNLKFIWDGYVGGLIYWLGQHEVERGSQPIYFYVLQIPFYEMLTVVFMLIASVYYLVIKEKRDLYNVFCIYWWVWSMLIYSWAGERMPWLAIHPLLPMILLAGRFAADVYKEMPGWRRNAGIAAFVILSMASVHGMMHVCFYGAGASPKESLVYVQSSTDTTEVSKKIIQFAHEMKRMNWASQDFRNFDPYNLEIVVEDYCTWPFAWYLRDFKRIAYQPKNIPEYEKGKPLILSGIEEANRGHDQRVYDLLKDDYAYTRYKLREWWAPDEKKWWDAPLFSKPNQQGKIEMLWRRFMYREVWNDLGSYDMVVYVRKDLEKFWR